MNNKILALLVSAVMVMVAWVAAVSVPGAEGEGDGSAEKPWMLMGNVSMEYQMALNDANSKSVTLEMDFNQIAFGAGDDDQKITVEWAASTNDYATGPFDPFYLLYTEVDEESDYYPATDEIFIYPADADEDNVCIEFSEVEPRMDGATKVRGVYDLTVDAKKETADPVYFLLKVTVLGDYGDNFGEYESFYYYGIHVSVVDEKSEATVLLSADGPDAAEPVVIDEAIQIPKDTELDRVYAYVNLEDSYDSKDFDFYAYGLPAGIAMKVDGVITGKVAVTVSADEEPTEFQVFAVHKENPGEVLTATYMWQVVAGDDEFEYTVEGVTKPSSEPSYKVMNNTGEEITISWTEKEGYEFKVYLTVAEDQDATDDATEFKMDITPGDGDTSVVIGGEDVSLEGITGIVQVTIVMFPEGGEPEDEEAVTAVTHILVVGPVVHSGLQPVVTAI